MNIRNLHREAIELVKLANFEFESGRFEEYRSILQKAFELEKASAEFLKDKFDAEPTRSVLFRSAANLAFSLKNYEEAYLLSFEGLKGNPYPEIKEELNDLLHSIADEYSIVSQPKKYNLDYLNSLKMKAVPMKLEEKSGKFGGAIVLSHVLDFLKNLQNSFQNFAEVQFRRVVKEDEVPDIDFLSNKFRNNCNLLVPDLNFKSFGVSIVADDGIMESFEYYTDEFKEMRTNLFLNFKEDVLLPEYNDLDFQQRISDKYNDEERRKIFTPVINSLSKSKPYTIAITGKNYTNKIKTFSPLSSTATSILKPEIEVVKQAEDLSLIKKIDQKIGNKTKTISFEFIKYIEFQIDLPNIIVGDKSVFLNSPHSIILVFNEGNFMINDEIYNVFVNANEYFEAINNYNYKFINNYSDLLNRRDDLLPNELELLDNFENNSIRNW